MTTSVTNQLAWPRVGAIIIATSQGGFADTATTDENGVAELLIHHDLTLGVNDIPVPLDLGLAEITIFNILGQQVWSEDQQLFSGMNHIQQGTEHLASGTYIIRIETAQNIVTKKSLLMRGSSYFNQLQFQIEGSGQLRTGGLGKQSEVREDTEIHVSVVPADTGRAFVPIDLSLTRSDDSDFSLTLVANDIPLFIEDFPDSVITGPFQMDVAGMVENDGQCVFSLMASHGGNITPNGILSWTAQTDGDTTEIAIIARDLSTDTARDTSNFFTLTYDAPQVWSDVDVMEIIGVYPGASPARLAIVNYTCQDDTTIQLEGMTSAQGYFTINLPFVVGEGSRYEIQITATAESNPQFTPRTIFHDIDASTTTFMDSVFTLIHNRDATFTFRDLDDTTRVSGLTAQVRDSESTILQTTQTDAAGQAHFTDIPTGSYHVEVGGLADYLARKTAFSISNRSTHADSIYTGVSNFVMIRKARPLPGADTTIVMTETELMEGIQGIYFPSDNAVYLPLALDTTMYLRLDSFTPRDSLYFFNFLVEADSVFGVDHSKWVIVDDFPDGSDGLDINPFGDDDFMHRMGYLGGYFGTVGGTLNMESIYNRPTKLYKEIYGRALFGLLNNITSRPNGSFIDTGGLPVPKDRVQFATKALYLQLKYSSQYISSPMEEGYHSDFLELLPE